MVPTPVDAATSPLALSISSSMTGQVHFEQGSTALELYFAKDKYGYYACESAEACQTALGGTIYPLCMEVVPPRGTASACTAWSIQQFHEHYEYPSSLYILDPTGKKTGWIGQPASGGMITGTVGRDVSARLTVDTR